MIDFNREKFLLESASNTFVHEEQFGRWLRKFFYLNRELDKEYNPIYQDSFYVIYYELMTVGLGYSKMFLESLKNSGNAEKIDFYQELVNGLGELKDLFSETEFQFIEYKRHSASHIFQEHYENRISEKGKVEYKRKGKLIDELNNELTEVLLDHGFDSGFDDYMINKLKPKINQLYDRLITIKMHHNQM